MASIVIVCDQITKAVVAGSVNQFRGVTVIPGFFNLVNWRNPGSAFGMFAGSGDWKTIFLSLMPLVALVVIAFMLRHAKDRATVFALSLIAGGAVGNMIDRVRFGEVVDFLDFYIGTYHWPAFNVADSCITVGVALYVYSTFKNPHENTPKDEQPESAEVK